MICSHCGNDVEKYAQQKDKICKSCYQRMNNCKSRHVKYVKFIDLSKKEQEEFLIKSNAHSKSNKSTKNKIKAKTDVKITKEPISYIIENRNIQKVNNIDTEKQVVLDDIMNTLKENNLIWPKDTTSIVPIFKQLKILLSDYIRPYLTVEDILNKMELDYKHAKEHYVSAYREAVQNSNSNEEINKLFLMKQMWEDRHNSLLEIRRGIKNVVSEYYSAGILFTELSNNKSFMEKFNKYYNNLIRTSEVLKDGNYKAKVSKLVASEDFCIGIEEPHYKSKIKIKYEVIVKTNSFVKTPNKLCGATKNFVRNVWAENEEEAKQLVIKFIKDNNFKFTYNKNDIIVNKLSGNISSSEEIL